MTTNDIADRPVGLDALLYPRSIAVIGASNDPTKMTGRAIRHLKSYNFDGRLVAINPTRPEVQGIPSYPTLDDVEGDIDLAMIMQAAAHVPDTLRACAKRGITAAIVAASGFAETGTEQGAALQLELDEALAETGIRILGPNCLGMISVRDRAVVTFTSALDDDVPLSLGPVALVSQSGAFGSFLFNAGLQEGLGWSHYFATGNETDLTVSELLLTLSAADEVTVLTAYMEGVNSGPGLIAAAQAASRADKPLVIVKSGRSAAGATAARSHTASLAGEDAVFDGVAAQHGILRVEGVEPLLDAAMTFSSGRRARGRRVTSLSVSGGSGVVWADAASARGLDVVTWNEEWSQQLTRVEPQLASFQNPIDLGANVYIKPHMLREALDTVLDHPETDLIAVLLGCADSIFDELIDIIEDAHNRTDRPIVVVWTGGNGQARKRLGKLGIPCFSDPLRAAVSLALLCDHSLRVDHGAPIRPEGIDHAAAARVISAARAAGRTQLTEHESTRLIAAYGVPTALAHLAATDDEAVEAARAIGRPVAIKVHSSRIGHKSDIGGVRLGLTEPEEIRATAQELLPLIHDLGESRPELLVQQMVHGDLELIIGTKQDPIFGPVVVVGFGGTLVEVLRESRVATAPVTHQHAVEMLTSLRGSDVFGEIRGRAAMDLDMIAEVITRVSWLAAEATGDLAELDVNPLMLHAEPMAVTAVDALAVLTVPRNEASTTLNSNGDTTDADHH